MLYWVAFIAIFSWMDAACGPLVGLNDMDISQASSVPDIPLSLSYPKSLSLPPGMPQKPLHCHSSLSWFIFTCRSKDSLKLEALVWYLVTMYVTSKMNDFKMYTLRVLHTHPLYPRQSICVTPERHSIPSKHWRPTRHSTSPPTASLSLNGLSKFGCFMQTDMWPFVLSSSVVYEFYPC